MKLSVILPCRNEEGSIGRAIKQIRQVTDQENTEIIVSDSSTDSSARIASALGAKVHKHGKLGYGVALLEGMKKAKGDYILIADPDGTYDFRDIPRFVFFLDKGYDMVIGDRFSGGIASMPFQNRIGNRLLSGLLRLFFNSDVRDAHCGIRAIKRKSLDKLELKAAGWEFASEMVIKAQDMRIKNIPIDYHPRIGYSKLKPIPAGWRHLRFMLMYSPNWLFMVPGLCLFVLGLLIMLVFVTGPVRLFGVLLYNRPMIVGSFLSVTGYQIILFGLYTKAYMKSAGFIRGSKTLDLITRYMKLETGILLSAILFIISLILSSIVILDWISRGFPSLQENVFMLALTVAIIAVQTLFSSFYISMLLVEKLG